jgi:hypothetical protein
LSKRSIRQWCWGIGQGEGISGVEVARQFIKELIVGSEQIGGSRQKNNWVSLRNIGHERQ